MVNLNNMVDFEKIKTEWDLEKHFFNSVHDERISKVMDSSKDEVAKYRSKWEGCIATNADNDDKFLEYLTDSAKLLKDLTHVYYYFSYLSTLNTQDQVVLKKKSEISMLYSSFSQELLFVDEEYEKIGYNKLIAISKMPTFQAYSNYLVSKANTLKYQLKPEQESVLIEKGNVTRIFNEIYTELTNSFEYPFKGEMLTRGQIGAKRTSADEAERKEASDSVSAKFGEKENQIVLGGIYKSVCKNNVASIKNRKIEGVMTSRNISEDMDDEVVNKLLDTVRANFPLYHQFLEKKAQLLGKDKLAYWDIFAPIPKPEGESTFDFKTGYSFYMDKIKEFDKEFYDYSLDIFQDGRVTVFPRKGKRDGAYASYNKGHKSFVMLNYVDDFDSVMTLTHELGHAIHGFLSQEQVDQVFSSPLSLAETASIFNETLVFESLLETISEEEKKYYIAKNLDDIFSTMFRQVQYVLFERECHQRFLDGEELGYEDFNSIWYKYVKELYGDAVEETDNWKYGWSSIPHLFNSPFYCYAYSFGNILSFNLYQMYKTSDNKESFKDLYKGILKAGGSKRPKELLSECGIDITSDKFYEMSFDVIKNLINKL